MFELLDEWARKAIAISGSEARRLNSEFIGTEHLLLGLTLVDRGLGPRILRDLNVDLKRIRTEIERVITPSTSTGPFLGQRPFSPRAKRVLELTMESGKELSHLLLGTEHLLLGLLMEGEGIAAQVLINLGLGLDMVKAKIRLARGQDRLGSILSPEGLLEFPCTGEARRILELSAELARLDGRSDVDSGHLLLGILQGPDSAARRALADIGLNADVLCDAVRKILGIHGKGRPDSGTDNG